MKGKVISTLIAAVAIVAAVGASTFFIHILFLRTEYKNTALEINGKILENLDQAKIRLGEKEAAANTKALDYYDEFLLNQNTVVYSRKNADDTEITEESILISLGKNELSFDKLEDGSAILVSWKTPDVEKHYRVRSQTTFMQLRAYGENYLKANS